MKEFDSHTHVPVLFWIPIKDHDTFVGITSGHCCILFLTHQNDTIVTRYPAERLVRIQAIGVRLPSPQYLWRVIMTHATVKYANQPIDMIIRNLRTIRVIIFLTFFLHGVLHALRYSEGFQVQKRMLSASSLFLLVQDQQQSQ